MKTIISLFLFSLLSLPAFANDNKLIGTWKSNKAVTMAYLKTHTHLTAPQLDKVASIIGKMTVTYDPTNVTMRLGEWKSVSPYKLVSETANSITVETKDSKTQKTSQDIIEFDGNGFWIPNPKIPGYKERFDKVVPSKP